MTFESHIDELHKKVMGTLIYLNRLKDSFEPETRVIVVQSLVLSLINYCFTVWGSTSSIHIKRVQKLQNFAARVALGNVRKYEHISPFLLQMGWLKMKEKFSYNVCVFMFKILRNIFPGWLYHFNTVDSRTRINTRQANDLVVRRENTDIGAREMSTCGPLLWNKLPSDIKHATSITVFRNKLKKYLVCKTE